MGELRLFDILKFKRDMGLNVFVETGLGNGNSFFHVLDLTKDDTFDSYHSIETHKPLVDECESKLWRYPNQKVNFLNEPSSSGLEKILKSLTKEDRVLFWLDAHFPGDAEGIPITETLETPKDLQIPLEKEMELIYQYRKGCTDMIMIDDLRIYEKGPYEWGNWEHSDLVGGGKGIGFIEEKFSESHHINKLYNQTGYLILIPKGD